MTSLDSYIGNTPFYGDGAARAISSDADAGTLIAADGRGITYVRVKGSQNYANRIGGYGASCDVYFGDLKVYDKTARFWYNSSTGKYTCDPYVFNGNYGGLNIYNMWDYWGLTPATQ